MNEFEYEIQKLQETKITATDRASKARFGESVSLSFDGNTLIVGACCDRGNVNDSGSVYVYKWNGSDWDETKIIASDGDTEDYFGNSVSIAADGNSFVVGAPKDDDNGENSGSVYFYKWNGSDWDETKIFASDYGYDDHFGESVSITADGNYLIIGAYKDYGKRVESGTVFVYKWNGSDWDETKIFASDGNVEDYFGKSVSVTADGNSFIVGTYHDDDNGRDSGSVYVYNWDGEIWNETKIIASNGNDFNLFGKSVSIAADGNSFIVGSPGDSGIVYLYNKNSTNWDEREFNPSDKSVKAHFGESVAFAAGGNSFIAGAYEDGIAYVYKWNGEDWAGVKIPASDAKAYTQYGKSVSMADWNCYVVGAPKYENSGAVYVYR